jgi:hypothetical protein
LYLHNRDNVHESHITENLLAFNKMFGRFVGEISLMEIEERIPKSKSSDKFEKKEVHNKEPEDLKITMMANSLRTFNLNSDRMKYSSSLLEQIEGTRNLETLNASETNQKVDAFMTEISKLYLQYNQLHIDQAETDVKDMKLVLDKAKDHIIEHYQNRLEIQLDLPFENNYEWLTVCKRRTNLEAFNIMFGKLVGNLDLQKIEECMQERKKYEGINKEDIPNNASNDFW